MYRQKLNASHSPKTLRRPNAGAIKLLEASTEEISSQVTSLLSDINFQYLRSIGVIKRSSSGRIPISKYQGFKDRELLDFVSKHNLEQNNKDWFRILSGRSMSIPEVAEILGTPLDETTKVARYLRNNAELSFETSNISFEQHNHLEQQGSQLCDEEEVALAQISDFVECYKLSPDDFSMLFCQTKDDQAATVENYEIPVTDLNVIEGLVNTFLIRDLVYRDAGYENLADQPCDKIGTISIHPYSGAVILNLEPWVERAGSFYIQQGAIEAIPDKNSANELRLFLSKIETLQHYSSTLRRVVETIVKHQEDFLISGVTTALAPLPQAWIAKECRVPRSTVCRLIRNKMLDTPHGQISLKQLCSSVGDVIRLLSKSNPDWNARKIAQYLQAVHNVRMTIRNINYHLNAG